MRKLSPAILLTMVSVAVSCRKEIQPDSLFLSETYYLKEIIASGSWSVTYFSDTGKDLTSDFSTYVIRFENDGIAVVHSTGIGILYDGFWSLVRSGNNNQEGWNHPKENYTAILQITLPGGFHMEELCGSWEITKHTATEMWLKTESQNSLKVVHLAST